MKTIKLCESSTGHLWPFLMYIGTGVKMELPSPLTDPTEKKAIVLNINEPIPDGGHTLWMDNYFNSLDVAPF